MNNVTKSRAPSPKFSAAALFHFTYGGSSYDPKTETELQGRSRCAVNAATAENWARENGYTFEWEVSDIDSSDFSDDPVPWALYDCTMRDAKGTVVQSLGACDFGSDARGPYGSYRRVVEAELATEEMPR